MTSLQQSSNNNTQPFMIKIVRQPFAYTITHYGGETLIECQHVIDHRMWKTRISDEDCKKKFFLPGMTSKRLFELFKDMDNLGEHYKFIFPTSVKDATGNLLFEIIKTDTYEDSYIHMPFVLEKVDIEITNLLQCQIDDIRAMVEAMSLRIASLESSNTALTQRVVSLEANNKVFEQRIVDLNAYNTDGIQRIVSLEQRVASIEAMDEEAAQTLV